MDEIIKVLLSSSTFVDGEKKGRGRIKKRGWKNGACWLIQSSDRNFEENVSRKIKSKWKRSGIKMEEKVYNTMAQVDRRQITIFPIFVSSIICTYGLDYFSRRNITNL